MKIGEQVLVVDSKIASELLGFDTFGTLVKDKQALVYVFVDENENYLNKLLTNAYFTDRKKAETDESIKQIIPYCILKHNNKFFCYKRGKKGTESRLHAKWSCGLGGHINPDGQSNITDIYWDSLNRELKEEIGLAKTSYAGQTLGFIYDDSNEVGRVHLGVCHLIIPLVKNLELKLENTIETHSWEKYDKMLEMADIFESWSQASLKVINGQL